MIHLRRVLATGLVAAVASSTSVVARGEEPARIEDNSFLVEEAYNQEHRVVQHVTTWMHGRSGAWNASFTQEWPVGGRRHQASYTIPVTRLADEEGGDQGLGQVALHYRFMWLGVDGGSVAFAPRVSALLPTADADRGLGAAAPGLQFNLPLSVVLAPRWVAHTNAGATFVRAGPGGEPSTRAFNLGQSLIWLAGARLNGMLEVVWDRNEAPAIAGHSDREDALFVVPGVRWAHNLASGLQIVPGVGVPIGLGPSADSRAIFLYLSLEHGF